MLSATKESYIILYISCIRDKELSQLKWTIWAEWKKEISNDKKVGINIEWDINGHESLFCHIKGCLQHIYWICFDIHCDHGKIWLQFCILETLFFITRYTRHCLLKMKCTLVYCLLTQRYCCFQIKTNCIDNVTVQSNNCIKNTDL